MAAATPNNTTANRFLAGNAAWRPSWTMPFTMQQMRTVGSAPDNPLMVLTCMDPRCEPTQYLGGRIVFGTVKNAGGRATQDAVRSIVTLRSLNTASEGGTVAVVHHTDCGMTHLTDAQIKQDVARRTPEGVEEAGVIEFGCFGADEFEETIRKDVETLKAEKLLAGMDILGFAFITETGELKVIE